MTLNPGPFNVKEHALLMVMCSMSFGGSYASTIYGSQKYIYNQDFGFGFKILIVWSTQLLGLSLASLTRRFLVWPSSMIWPSNLPYCAMLNSLHGISTSEGDILGKGRFKLFWLVCGVTFLYQFFPTYIFTMLLALWPRLGGHKSIPLWGSLFSSSLQLPSLIILMFGTAPTSLCLIQALMIGSEVSTMSRKSLITTTER